MPGTNRPPPERRAQRPAPPGMTPARRRTRLLAGAFTIGVHIAAVALLLLPRGSTPPSRVEDTSEPIQVSLIDTPRPQPPGPPDVTLAQPEAASAPPLPHLTIRATVRAAMTTRPDNSDLLSASQLAGAASVGAGGGGGGGGCDMARAVQQALRRDPLVRAAVEDAHRLGKSVMLWNGDWVRSGGAGRQGPVGRARGDHVGSGLRAGSLPQQQVHGLVLLSLADGSTRFAIGAGDWRWSDLLDRARGRSGPLTQITDWRKEGPARVPDAAPILRQDITINTTRRFCARPARVLLSATGSALP